MGSSTPVKQSNLGRLLEQAGRLGERVFGLRRRIATAAAAVLTVLLAYHVVFGQNGLTVYRAKRHDAAYLRQQIDTLSDENGRLRSHVDRLQSDPGAIEHEAREELHYARPGEVIYTLPQDRTAK